MVNGNLHREDGSAVDNNDGHKEWWLNGNRHRIGEPAIIFASRDFQYYENNKCSQKDSPAVINTDGYSEYWVDGRKLDKEEFNKKYLISKKLKIK